MKTEMVARLESALRQTAQQTFESLAFMLVLDETEYQPPADATTAAARVVFAGPFDGEIVLEVSRVMLPVLAANMLGLEDGQAADADQQHDALKELLNVICGNLLPEIAGPVEVFSVGAPQMVESPSVGDAAIARAAAQARVWLDSGRARLAVLLSPDARERLSGLEVARQGT